MKKTLAGRLLSVAISATLFASAACPAPVMARAADTEGVLAATERSEAQIDAMVHRMLSSGSYVEGEAVVCSLPTGSDGLSAQADSLLAGAERLSEVTARQYAEATGETVSASSEGLTAQSEDEPVEVLLVHMDNMSTSELLHKLLNDSRVLSAEPNYLMGFAENDGEDLAGNEPAAIASDVLSEEESQPIATELQATIPGSVSDEEEASQLGGASSQDATDEDTAVASGEDKDDSAAVASADTNNTLGSELVAQSAQAYPGAAGAATNLTHYQWFSVGAAAAIPQYLNEDNPGVHAPSWNEPGATNANGVVAILDSGVDYTHPDLAGVMYHFSPALQEELSCGEFGYAPAREDKTDPMDGYNHGTHCAGIVAAQWNDFGVSGVASGVKLLAVSVSNSLTDSDYSYDSIIKGYDFIIRAAKAGVDIRSINRSINKNPSNNANEAMVRAAGEMGIVTCEASGNEHDNLDDKFTDVSLSQPNPYLVRVNASNPQDARAPFSCYGRTVTDLFAPGVTILSTVPSNIESTNRYFVEADQNPLYLKTTFADDDLLDVPSSANVELGEVAPGTIGYDGDSSSLKVGISTQTGCYARVCVDVPVGNLSKNDVQDLSVTFNVGTNEARYCNLDIIMEDGSDFSEQSRDNYMDTSDSGPNGWCFTRLHIPDPSKITKEFKHVTDSKGRTCIRLCLDFRPNITSYEEEAPMATDMYIDQIAIGGPNNSGFLPYSYMNGTSMATPIVTGAAAIVSSGIDASSPAERAALTVQMLKSAVHQAPGYQGFCKQNGQLDLSLLSDAENLIPEIESAQVVGDTLVVLGNFFGSQGKLLLGDDEANVLSWAEDAIEVALPAGFKSGLIPVTVRTGEGAEVCRAFIIEIPSETGSVLYEDDLTPIALRTDNLSATGIPKDLVASEDGVLYAVPEDSDNRTYSAMRCLMYSEDQGKSWQSIDLPVELKDVSLAVGGGKVYMRGGIPADKSYSEDYWQLYSYDISTGEFALIIESDASLNDEEHFSYHGSLAYVAGQLYFVDLHAGEDYQEPAHIRIRRVNLDTGLLENSFLLSHDYARTSFNAAPKVAVTGSSIYICSMTAKSGSSESAEKLMGLECATVSSDGSLSSTDLSAALDPLLTVDVKEDDFCIAACDEGVFLIGRNLDNLLPEGSEYTDTFLLKNGASAFEPFAKTLSYAPLHSPVAECSYGRLYAYSISKFEDTPIFGRSTDISEPEPGPEPKPQPDPQPQPSPVSPQPDTKSSTTQKQTSSSRTTLAKTGDSLAEAAPMLLLLVTCGFVVIMLGSKCRTDSK